MRNLAIISFVLAGLATACGGGEGSGGLGGNIVGSWRELPNATDTSPDPVGERAVVTFSADGTLTTSDQPAETGMWTTSGGDLTITDFAGSEPITVPYLAAGDRLVLAAFVAVDGADGFVGTWISVSRIGEDESSRTFELRADNTAHVEIISNDVQIVDGTWHAVGSDLAIDVVSGGNVTSTLRTSLVNGVLGNPLEKI